MKSDEGLDPPSATRNRRHGSDDTFVFEISPDGVGSSSIRSQKRLCVRRVRQVQRDDAIQSLFSHRLNHVRFS
jgi:hypothetical protein